MFISTLPMLFVPEGGIIRSADSSEIQQTDDTSTSSTKLFIVFLIAMVFINWGRNSIAIIRAQYLVLESGFAVSSRVLSYITNAESLAIILMGPVVGWIGKRIGDGKTLLFGTFVAITSLLLFATAQEVRWIYLSNFLRGCSDVIILASSYAYASVLIPAEKRARYFSLFNATLFLSWGLAGTCIAGPLIDLLIASGTTHMFAYQMAFVAAALMTAIGLIIASLNQS
jgi:MFS family permease